MRNLVPGIPVAKILIQRDESTEDKRPVLYYEKYPKQIEGKLAIICDPMLATGGSVIMGMLNSRKTNVIYYKNNFYY